ncbi:MAG: cytochrome b N-terminal domain-containing protein, partial [Nitrososphaerales archaeon]
LNFGQMLLWHVVLLPLILVVLVGAHVLLVRVRGVVHPMPLRAEPDAPKTRESRRAARAAEAAEWRGATRRYDIAKEGAFAAVIVLALTFLLSGLLSSPDVPPIDLRTWATAAPADFLGTTASELAGTSVTANYGPPYNNGSSNVQRIGVSWQLLAGVHEHIDPAQSFVLRPLSAVAPTNPQLDNALARYNTADQATQQGWAQAYIKALDNVRFVDGAPRVPRAKDGPVPVLAASELTLARAGGLDANLIAHQTFYGTNFTKPLLFLEDGSYFASQAKAQHLTGNQWGVMNETGSYPGQPWLWLYQLWYQIPGFRTSANVDLIAIYLTGAATLLLLLVPFIPGLRDIPRLIPLHRLVWRSYYRSQKEAGSGGTGSQSAHSDP